MKQNSNSKTSKVIKYYIGLAILIILALVLCNSYIIPYIIHNSRDGFTKESFTETPEKADKIVYCCWTGNNSMSDDRKRCYESIITNIGVKVVLITPENLNEFIKPEYPLHKSYEYLSYTHKADYLRTYLMHIYGGGYTDIKETNYSWDPYFDVLNNLDNKWGLGYAEASIGGVACSKNCEWVKDNWQKLIGNGSYIFKRQTPFTLDWFNELNKVLDEKYEALKANPAQVSDDSNSKEIKNQDGTITISKYPLGWAEILGDIFHTICYKYNDKIIQAFPHINTSNYR